MRERRKNRCKETDMKNRGTELNVKDKDQVKRKYDNEIPEKKKQ